MPPILTAAAQTRADTNFGALQGTRRPCGVRKVGSACKSVVLAHSIEFMHPTRSSRLRVRTDRCIPTRAS